MYRCVLVVLFTVMVAALTSSAHAKQHYSLARIDLESEADLQKARSLPVDLVWLEDDYVDVVVESHKLYLLDDAGLRYSVEIEDMASFYRSRLLGREDGVGSMGGYRTLSEIYLVMDSIANEHPSIVQPRWAIGQSLEGRDIYVMKISDNPGVDEDEPEIYYNATIHAREVITPEVLIRFMRHLTDNYGADPTVTSLVDGREMFFTPCQNPDGYYHNEVTDPDGGGMWRKNRRDNGNGTWGVDLNRNYGYMWGYNNDGSSPYGGDETYRGTGPFSEPETQVVRDFALTRDFSVVVAYHSFTNVILWPFGYSCSPTPDNSLFGAVGALAAQFNGYGYGTCCGINGYTGDWYYGEQTEKPKVFEFLVEVGGQSDGFWPLPSRITPLVEENVQPNMIYARFAGGDTLFLRPPATPILEPIGDVTSFPLELNWSHEDPINPAVGFDIWKLSSYEKITDDAEGTSAYWQSHGFTRTMTRSHSGYYSYWSTDTAPCDFSATTADLLNVEEGDSLRFWIWYDNFEDWSYGYLEVLAEGQDWTSIPGNITTTDDPHGLNLGHGITGSSGGWVEAIFDLSAYEGQMVYYRVRFVAAEFQSEGMYIDDIYPVGLFDEELRVVENHPDTSYVIDGLPMGSHWFQVFAVDVEGQISTGSSLEHASVSVYVTGDADGSGGIDVDDVVFLVTYIFASGPAPDPPERGDADCSGGLDIDDVVYLVNYIFGGGPVPGDPDDDGIPDC